jgi:hypothetical protein
VQDEARRSANLAQLDRFIGRDDGSRLSSDQATSALDRARAERDPQPTGPTSNGDIA